jgi:hypothetical protein
MGSLGLAAIVQVEVAIASRLARRGGHHGHAGLSRTRTWPRASCRVPAIPPRPHLPATKPPNSALSGNEQLRRLAATGEPVRGLAEAFGIGRATAYRYLKS